MLHPTYNSLLLPACHTVCMLSGKSVGWHDTQGQGVKNDFCRFVSAGGNTWFTCALAGTAPLSCSVTKSGVFSLNPIDSTEVLYPMTLQKILSKGDTCANGACAGLTTDGCGKHGRVMMTQQRAGWGVFKACGVPADILSGPAASPPNDATACYCLWCMHVPTVMSSGTAASPPPGVTKVCQTKGGKTGPSKTSCTYSIQWATPYNGPSSLALTCADTLDIVGNRNTQIVQSAGGPSKYAHGSRAQGRGSRAQGHGSSRVTGPGSWIQGPGSWIQQGHGLRVVDPGPMVMDPAGSRAQGRGSRAHGHGSRVQGPESRV